MIDTKHLLVILNKPQVVCDLYDREMNLIAKRNGGEYKIDQDTQLEVSKKAFSTICKEDVHNVTYEECVAIFDLIDRGN